MATVEFKGVYKSFGEVEVIHGFDLSIKDGEFIVLVGPSGCGKSTILRMLAGLETVTRGEVWIGDRMVNDVPPKDRDIAMVFQNYALYPHMTVAENIGFGLKMRGVPKSEIKKKVEWVAEQLEIKDYLDRKPKELSGGQKQRVAMGRAIARDPAVFLFDEPLSSLDAELRIQIRKEIALLHKRLGTTTIYVTHDQIEALTLAERIVVMNEGSIQQLGTPSEVYRDPNNTFVAGFIGHPKMNFLSVEPGQEGESFFLQGNGFRIKCPPRVVKALPKHKVLLGIRPEFLSTRNTGEGHVVFEGTVELKEPVGNETYITVELAPFSQVVYRVSGQHEESVGQRVKIGALVKNLCFFDNLTGVRLRISIPAR